MEAYRRWGADRGEGGGGGVVRNRNEQFRRERRKYEGEKEEEEKNAYGAAVEEVLFVDAKRGQGTHAISRAVYKAGRHVNERRRRRGLNDRPLRVGIIGFPNVGKVGVHREIRGVQSACCFRRSKLILSSHSIPILSFGNCPISSVGPNQSTPRTKKSKDSQHTRCDTVTPMDPRRNR